ncbi:DUF7683 domain-containing protein [Streptomyces sp. URMC 126]|uniref:DUF7683 domain-containing protein n=1 Tax=Streptomyces sp. URMC 126 TaxID=3423401 RepID=UPI003F198939
MDTAQHPGRPAAYYTVTAFAKGEDFPAYDMELPDAGPEFLAGLFGIPVERFANVYSLEERHRAALERTAGLTFDPAAYDYFLYVTAAG